MSTLRVNTLQNAAGTSDPAISGAAKAWVNFNGTGTVAIRASFNVTSITDNGTGQYTINFTNSLTDANYSGVVTTGQVSDGTNLIVCTANFSAVPTSSAWRINVVTRSGGVDTDSAYMSATVFR